MVAHQAPPSLGFSKQEHWSGLPFPSPMHESESEVAQSCPTFSDPMDCSLPGSSIHGIFQARVLEWDAINGTECTQIPIYFGTRFLRILTLVRLFRIKQIYKESIMACVIMLIPSIGAILGNRCRSVLGCAK